MDAYPADAALRNAADDIIDSVNDMITYCYLLRGYIDQSDPYGLSVFFSLGNELNNGVSMFSWQWWYNPGTIVNTIGQTTPEKYYGNLDWCRNGAVPDNDDVENWFELMDAWYDGANDDGAGGWNLYHY